jgi:hypothetical protein
MHALKDTSDSLYQLNTIVGTTESFEAFKNYMNNTSEGLIFATAANGKTCYLSGMGSCKDAIVRVPEYSYTGLPITHIGSTAFKEFKTAGQLAEMIVPWGITYIGASAFYGCTTLETITLPDSVSEIKENAFYGCTKLTNVNLGGGLKTIGEHAFHGCTSLEGISIPDGITIISDGLFFGCKNLISLIIPEGVTHIGRTAFSDCSKLESIIIPKSVTSIDNMAFMNCTNLKEVGYSGTQADWAKITIGTQNTWLTNATLTTGFEYAQDSGLTGGATRISDIANGPFIYICRDTDEEFNSANKMFIKLPGDDQIVEISRGATVLSSNYTNNGYTYEGLAEILARINKRLEAIGGEELKINNDQTTLIKVPTLKEVNELVPDKEVVEYLDPESIPTIQSVKADLDKLIEEVYALTEEVEYELEHGQNNQIFSAESRIDKLEDWQKGFRVNDIEYYDTIEWTD